MKKKLIYSILITSLLFVVCFVTVYAAFIVTHHYEAEISYHEIKNTTLTNSTQNSKVTFTKPGDQINVTYNLTNSDSKEYEYYYSFEWNQTDYSNNVFLNMIYVYQNGEYCGLLKDYLVSGVIPKKDLPYKDYIFSNETRSTIFTFELHNAASSFPESGLSIDFVISAKVLIPSVQTTLFVNSSNISKSIENANNGGSQTLVLNSNISTTGFEIKKDMVIDLCGKTLDLTSSVNLAEGVNVKIIDTRGGGSVSGEGFNISHESSFVELEAPVSKITKTAYNKSKLIEILANKFDTYNVVYANEDYDIFSYYKVYGLTATSTDVTITNGIIKASTYNTNGVITVIVDGVSYEFKYIGYNIDVIADIVNNQLKHMSSFADPMNGIQVANDLFLPTAIKEYGATISWNSNNTDVLSNDGKVQEEQGNVLLTATIKVFDVVFIQEYFVYIIQPDNLSKLQYLIARVEQGVTVNPDTPGAYTLTSELRVIGEKRNLPISGVDTTLPYHYTLWTDGLDLGITDIEYVKESMYQYIDLEQEVSNEKVTEATVSLNQITYSKAARVEIIATFDNGETLSSFITITITLEESDLAYEVFEDIQLDLDKVDVLQNILDTRNAYGVKYESGNFFLRARVDVVELEYVSKDTNLYNVVPVYGTDEEGNQIIEKYEVQFVDLRYLSISDKRVAITCKIVERDPYKEIISKDLYFTVPGAITTYNFESMSIVNGQVNTTKIFDMSNDNIKRLFYSIKLQTLQQTQYPYFDKKTVGGIVNLVDVTDYNDIYSLGEYILIDDINKVDKLMFEYGRTTTILNYYDLEVLLDIFEWATLVSTSTTSVKNTPSISDHVDSNLEWIANDGKATLSDGEIAVILSYGEKYTGFNDVFYSIINTLDNKLTDDEIGIMLEALAQDKTYVSILNWIRNSSEDIPLNKWLLMLDENSEYYDPSILEEQIDSLDDGIAADKNIPVEFLLTVNGDSSNITNEEERLVVYYVLANHIDKYLAFINAWQSYIERKGNDGSLITTLVKNTTVSYNLSNGGTARNPDDCYDPIFTAIYNWAFYVGAESEGVDGKTLKAVLTYENIDTVFTAAELEYTRKWYRNDIIWTNEGEQLTVNEWKIIAKYLNYLGITEIDGYVISPESGNSIIEGLDDESNDNCGALRELSLSAGLLSKTTVTLTDSFLNSIITAVNNIYSTTAATNYNKLVAWAKNTDIGMVTWKDALNDQSLSLSSDALDNIRVKDCKTSISVDEFTVLEYYLGSVVLGSSSINDNLRQLLVSILLNVDLELQSKNITAGYNAILLAVNDTGDFETVVDSATTLGTQAPTTTDFDNLSTISSEEIKKLILIKPDNDDYVKAVQDAFGAYSITVTKSGETYTVTVIPFETGLFNRDLSEENQNYIADKVLEKITSNVDDKYTHITVGQITTAEVDVFRVLTYYQNLSDISFRGTSATYLFDSNLSANSTFSLVAVSSKNLEKISMNYCGISDISAVTNLLNLKHLNLRSNYGKTEGSLVYQGLESISQLIELNDLKNNNQATYPKLEYVNVYDTDVTMERGEVVLGKLYQENNNALLYIDVFGEEKSYPFDLNGSEAAIYALSLLYELDSMTGEYIILPSKVYRNVINNGTNVTTSYDIEWKVVIANSLVKIGTVSGYKLLQRLSNETGQITISASITVDGKTETRYFVITIRNI